MKSSGSDMRPLRADARCNIERLIVAAKAEFAERGRVASLDEIAKRAGVGPGTLYRRFPTRESLIDAVLKDQFDELHQQATSLASTVAPDIAIERWLHDLLANSMTYHGVAASLVNATLDDGSRLALPAICQQVHTDGEAMVAMAQAEGVIRNDVTFPDIARLLTGIALSLADAPESSDTGDRLFRVAMDGIRHQPQEALDASADQ